MHDRGFHREPGLAEHEQIVGFLDVGSPARAEEPAADPVDLWTHLRWL